MGSCVFAVKISIRKKKNLNNKDTIGIVSVDGEDNIMTCSGL